MPDSPELESLLVGSLTEPRAATSSLRSGLDGVEGAHGDVRISQQDGITVAALAGEIDLFNAASLRDEMVRNIPHTTLGVVIDLSGVSYLASHGVQIILALADRLKGRGLELRVAVPAHSPVRRVLAISGVDQVVPLDESVSRSFAQLAESRA